MRTKSASPEEVVVAGSSELPVVNIVPVASGIVTVLSLPVGLVTVKVVSNASADEPSNTIEPSNHIFPLMFIANFTFWICAFFEV